MTLERRFRDLLSNTREREEERTRQYKLAAERAIALHEDKATQLHPIEARLDHVCRELANALGQTVVKTVHIAPIQEIYKCIAPTKPFYTEGEILNLPCGVQYCVNVGMPEYLKPYVRIVLSTGAIAHQNANMFPGERERWEYPPGLTLDVVYGANGRLVVGPSSEWTLLEGVDFTQSSRRAFVSLKDLSSMSDDGLANLIGELISSPPNTQHGC